MEEINHNINNLKDNFSHFESDVDSFLSKGNKSAATRARKSLLEISKLCKEVRKQIQDIKNAS